MIPEKRRDGLMKDQNSRVLSEISSQGCYITYYNSGIYIPLTAWWGGGRERSEGDDLN